MTERDEVLRDKFVKILSPAIDASAPYAKVMIDMLVKEALSRPALPSSGEVAVREALEECDTWFSVFHPDLPIRETIRSALAGAEARAGRRDEKPVGYRYRWEHTRAWSFSETTDIHSEFKGEIEPLYTGSRPESPHHDQYSRRY